MNSKTAVAKATSIERIILTETDITDKKYESLAELEVNVNKTTIFHADPTKEDVNKKLKEEAAKLGADAVVLVRYGTVGVSLMSWGSLNGKGRAVKFVQK
jgi:predicted metal-dependent phosphotriesterase family hydrolase